MRGDRSTSKALARGLGPLLFLGLALGALAAAFFLLLPRSPEPRSPRDPLLAAKAAFAERDFARAEELLRSLLHARPADRQAKTLLGRVLIERGRLAAARGLFSEILKESPDDYEATRGLGLAYRGLGQGDLGVIYLQRAAKLRPEDPLAWRELGMAQREGDPFGALTSFRQSLALDPEQGDLSALAMELAVGKSPRFETPTVGRAGPIDPLNPRPINPEELFPRLQAPDPTRHFKTGNQR